MESYDEVIEFLLENSPIRELGGSISNVIESYRFGAITKAQAISVILKDYNFFITKYIKESKEIARSINTS